MPVFMPSDTREVLRADAERCESRSLLVDRFADPAAKDSCGSSPRRSWFSRMIAKPPVRLRRTDWLAKAPGGCRLYAQLQSRLMANMAGGVMENAGLCLDRFGLPYIPGSAVKGCARRAALAALHEWCETGQKPGAADDDKANVFMDACEQFTEPAELLAAIARVFGWGEQDWMSDADTHGRFKSDFAWACDGRNRLGIWQEAAKQLAAHFGRDIEERHQNTPWDSLPNFAGSVSFLPAFPVDVTGVKLPLTPPLLGKLELDVVTCHHPDYYAQKSDKSGRLLKPVATDDEDPNPVAFPAVAAGHVFAFALAPLRNCPADVMQQARLWLALGLSTFGLGAKTAAGYGWFDSSKTVDSTVAEMLAKREQLEKENEQRERQSAKQQAQDEAERRRKEADKAAMASLTPEQQEDYRVAQLSEDQFRSALDSFVKKNVEEQKAMVRALRANPEIDGSRRAFWDDLKQRAARKGGKLAHTEQAIRQLSRQMFPGKEGKMP